MRITIVLHSLKAGGAERVVSMLSNAWSEQGRAVSIITLSPSADDFYSLHRNIFRYSIGRHRRAHSPVKGFFLSLSRIARLSKALRTTAPQVIISFLPVTNVLTLLASYGMGLRVVISERNDPKLQHLGWPWDMLRKWSYARADCIVANSRGVSEGLRAYASTDKIHYIPNPLVVPDSIAPACVCRPTVLNVARLTSQKAHDVLLRAFARIRHAVPDWQLAVAGDGPLRDDLVVLSGSLGIADRIDWLGTVSDPFAYYRAASIFALPSRYEGTPNALLEAMACGLPVIVSDASPGPLEYVEHEISGLVVPPDDERRLADALLRLACDEELRKRLGREAQKRLSDSALPLVLEKWERVLE